MSGFSTVTEIPGIGATREQLAMLYTRYKFASQFCAGKEVLEVACGAGQGLGYLARTAKRVVGGDIDEAVLSHGEEHYRGREAIQLRTLDAQDLPFSDSSFDVVILYEAVYYLPRPDLFLAECHRILRDNGLVLICTVNREWSDFNPSPYCTRYFSARELGELLQEHGFTTELFGAFPIVRESAKDSIVSHLKRTAVSLHLMPRTMRGKQLLKRLFFGKLAPLPSEVVDGMAEYSVPVLIDRTMTNDRFKVIYAAGQLVSKANESHSQLERSCRNGREAVEHKGFETRV